MRLPTVLGAEPVFKQATMQNSEYGHLLNHTLSRDSSSTNYIIVLTLSSFAIEAHNGFGLAMSAMLTTQHPNLSGRASADSMPVDQIRIHSSYVVALPGDDCNADGDGGDEDKQYAMLAEMYRHQRDPIDSIRAFIEEATPGFLLPNELCKSGTESVDMGKGKTHMKVRMASYCMQQHSRAYRRPGNTAGTNPPVLPAIPPRQIISWWHKLKAMGGNAAYAKLLAQLDRHPLGGLRLEDGPLRRAASLEQPP